MKTVKILIWETYLLGLKVKCKNALNDEFPNGLGLPHVEIEEN
jgi:hypothetical protein